MEETYSYKFETIWGQVRGLKLYYFNERVTHSTLETRIHHGIIIIKIIIIKKNNSFLQFCLYLSILNFQNWQTNSIVRKSQIYFHKNGLSYKMEKLIKKKKVTIKTLSWNTLLKTYKCVSLNLNWGCSTTVSLFVPKVV